MYYVVGRCVMRKCDHQKLPSLIGVAKDKENAWLLAGILNSDHVDFDTMPDSLSVVLRSQGVLRKVELNDFTSVENVTQEVARHEEYGHA